MTTYVPVLRWKEAERRALLDLKPATKSRLRPLIEIIPARVPRYNDAERRAYMSEFVNDLGEAWGLERAFVDASLLRPHFLIEGASVLKEVVRLATDKGMAAVPVVHLPRTKADPHADVFASSREAAGGVCLRLKPMDLALKPHLRTSLIDRFLDRLHLVPTDVDLIVDEEFTFEDAPGYTEVCEMVPHLQSWRSFTIISGDFPEDLQDYSRGLIHERRRRDWYRWMASLNSGRLSRKPDYGDYTIQWPAYHGPVPGEIPNPSVSVRYTANDRWLICRGEAPRDGGPGLEQWNGWAKLLIERPEYSGHEFSHGDHYIYQRAAEEATTGNFTTWISAGINHHITLAVEQAQRAA